MSKALEDDQMALVPRLRFPEFRQTDEWTSTNLGAVCDMQAGKYVRVSDIHEEFAEGLNPCYGGNGLRGFTATTTHTGDYPLIGRQGALCGNVTFVHGAFHATEHAVVVTADDDTNCNWLFYLLVVLRLNQYATGQAQPGLSVDNLRNVSIAVPAERDEQQKIADYLAAIDERNAAIDARIDTLKIHKKGLMQQLFPRAGDTTPRLRFPEFRGVEGWEQKPLSKFISSLDAGTSVNAGDRPAGANELGILKTSCVTDGVFGQEKSKVVVDPNEQSRLKEPVQKNTIIISRMNTPALVGANAYIERSSNNLFLPDRLWAAKPQLNVSMRFIAYILGSGLGRSALSALATGTSGSMKNISKPAVLELQITAPKIEEQQKIADCLSSLDELIAAATAQRDALREHKKGMMQQLFPPPNEAMA